MYNDMILEGIKVGDQIGGPYELSKIVNSSLVACKGFNKKDLTARYLKWWETDAFQCQALSKRSKLQCKNAALKGKRVADSMGEINRSNNY